MTLNFASEKQLFKSLQGSQQILAKLMKIV